MSDTNKGLDSVDIIMICVLFGLSTGITQSELKHIEDKIDRIEKNIGYLPPLQNIETRKETNHD